MDKGVLQSEIQTKERELRRDDGADGAKQQVNKAAMTIFTCLDIAPRKYANASLRKNLTAKKAPETINPFYSGGLDDDDIVSSRPPSFPPSHPPSSSHSTPLVFPSGLQRDNSCKNNKSQARTKLVQPKHSKKAPKILEDHEPSADSGFTELTGANFLNDTRWAQAFIPTITHALYVSRDPFLDFAAESSTFLATVQEVFDLLFPNVDFALTMDDPLVTTAYKRLNSRKSKLASGILEGVVRFFEGDNFVNQPTKIRDYVCWAIKITFEVTGFPGPIAATFELLYEHPATSADAKDVGIRKFSMVLAGEVARLASKEPGWHFSASHGSASQIQAFSVEDMATKLETQAPFVWKVLGHLLEGDNTRSTSAPAPQSTQPRDETGALEAEEANYWLMQEERLGMQLESDAVW
ncbi:hypothetical protein DXG03_009295 [Asterophora parasitica]|uniref:Uncharacterized protein n=1 Tax=Asterophora parasitica TaxID=117018 RepID=A0A9P7K8W0_9AGAR|nr:hypothetical protein DXG03_009295 [Asterophora parasitica]